MKSLHAFSRAAPPLTAGHIQYALKGQAWQMFFNKAWSLYQQVLISSNCQDFLKTCSLMEITNNVESGCGIIYDHICEMIYETYIPPINQDRMITQKHLYTWERGNEGGGNGLSLSLPVVYHTITAHIYCTLIKASCDSSIPEALSSKQEDTATVTVCRQTCEL